MCRLFGFRSVIPSQVHRSLVRADNALMRQSDRHPDGWGVAYYVEKAPHVIKSVQTAMDDHLFKRVSGIVSSQTVVAHLRKATTGELSILNTHPFQHGKWTFAHNGNIKGFAAARDGLVQLVAPALRRYLLGETDSELIFFLLLTHLSRRVELHRSGVAIDDLAAAARICLDEITATVGSFHPVDGPPTETYLTFILTNGSTMLAHQGGKSLLYSTYKTLCPDRNICPSFAPECEGPTTSGFVNHLVVSSEALQGENVWIALEPGEMVGVDWRMKLECFPPPVRA